MTRVLFEPWAMGDALIAASMFLEPLADAVLACHPRWHSLIKDSLGPERAPRLLPVTLPYTDRARSGPLDLGNPSPLLEDARAEVLSIRGDLRDLWAARRLLPGSRIRMRGWTGYLARRVAVADLPYALGLRAVRNRYRAWASLAGVSFPALCEAFRRRQESRRGQDGIVIHVGAQWRAKQYPFAAELKRVLQERGRQVRVLAGPRDPLPRGIEEHETLRAADRTLVEALRESAHVVANDSGPMHLAALLGCRTIVVACVSNLAEWIPPRTEAVISARMPRGYRPHPRYQTDDVLSGWPEPACVAAALEA